MYAITDAGDAAHTLAASDAGNIDATQDIFGKVAKAMSPTLAVDYAEEQVLQAEFAQQQSPAYIREFCNVCYTDNVSVRPNGAVYCPECGHTAQF